MKQEKEYYAFISYKREDEKWAKWLQHKLEHYRFPMNLNGRTDLPKNIRPTFRDVTDLKPGLLSEEINNALQNSQWLIVVCSPRSAKSQWVCKEAQTFIDLGRADHIIPFIIEGIPFSNDPTTECYPEALLNLTGSNELLAANTNEMGRDAAVIKVVASMFNLRFDSLWQRYEREQKRKRWIWIIIAILIALFGLCIGGYFVQQNRTITKQKKQLENAANRLREDSLTLANHISRIQNDSVQLVRKNERIQIQRDSLILTNKLLAEERNNVLIANWSMMENQGRAVAEKAKQEIAKGNVKDAMLALLMVSPYITHYPYVPEVEAALRCALNSINSNRYNYQLVSGNVDYLLVNDDGKRFVQILKDKTLKCYDSNTLECISGMQLPDVEYTNVYMSGNGQYILLQDSNFVYCYDMDKSKQISKKSMRNLSKKEFNNFQDQFLNFSKTVRGNFLGRNIYGGVSNTPKCEFYNHKSGIALYHEEFDYDDTAEEIKPVGLYTLFDIKNNKSLCEKYDYILYESDYQITSTELSPNGRYWANAYVNGDVEIFDIQTNKSQVWKHPEVDGHYSNYIKFSSDSKWLFQTHAFQEYINILNVENMCLIDSIKTEESPEGATVCLLANNNILCRTISKSFIYTKGKQCLETIYREGKFNIDDKHRRISIEDENGTHIYNVIKLDDEESNISKFELATNKKINIESDGFSVRNGRSNNIIWKHNNIMEAGPRAFTSDYQYGFISNGAPRGGDYICILEMSEGTPMIDYLCSDFADIYYAEREGIVFIKEFENLITRKFPLYKELLNECQRITSGMKLSKDKKRMFFLE